MLGLTSPNQAVDNNFNYAVEIYKHMEEKQMRPEFKIADKKHKFFTKVDGGLLKMPNAIAENIELFYDLIDTQFNGDTPRAVDWLTRRHAPEKVMQMMVSMGQNVPNIETTKGFQHLDRIKGVYGSEIFGYKVGTFVANLLGQSDVATIDLWMSRQINRWLGEPYVATNSDVGRMFADNFFAPNSKVTKMRDEADVRQNFLLFRDVVEGIANDKRITEKFGRKVSTMEVQALLWYMEKALYLTQNARSQKELGESDYGSYAEIRAEKRRNPDSSNKDIAEVKPRRGEGAYLRGSGKRAFEDSFAENSQGEPRTDRLKPRRR